MLPTCHLNIMIRDLHIRVQEKTENARQLSSRLHKEVSDCYYSG